MSSMKGLPPISGEDVQVFDEALDTLLAQTGAVAAILIHQGGPVISQAGDASRYNTISLAAVAAGAFAASCAVAMLMGETQVASFCQQGQELSMLVSRVDDDLLLLVIYKSALIGAESIRHHATNAIECVASQVQRAASRAPVPSFDVAALELPDVSQMFRRKDSKQL